MKKSLFILLIFLSISFIKSYAQSGDVQWISWEELEASMKENPKKILIYIHANKIYSSEILALYNNETAEILEENYYCVRLNAESVEPIKFDGFTYVYELDYYKRIHGTHGLALHLLKNTIIYPSFVFLDDNYWTEYIKRGKIKPRKFKKLIKKISNNEL